MNRALLLVTGALLGAYTCSASTMCGSDTLAGYLALGAGGCTVGTSTFTGFSLLDLPTGATALDPGTILITPITTVRNPGFIFNINATAGSGDLLEILFGYQVTGAPIIANTLSMAGSSAMGDGVVTVTENKCLGGAFAPGMVSGCTGSPANLIVFDIGVDAETAAKLTFPSVRPVGVVTDIAVDGGPTGSAALGSVTTQFQAVPEPASVFIVSTGLGALLYIRRRSRAGESL